jgi:hypothetical protein
MITKLSLHLLSMRARVLKIAIKILKDFYSPLETCQGTVQAVTRLQDYSTAQQVYN